MVYIKQTTETLAIIDVIAWHIRQSVQ